MFIKVRWKRDSKWEGWLFRRVKNERLIVVSGRVMLAEVKKSYWDEEEE